MMGPAPEAAESQKSGLITTEIKIYIALLVRQKLIRRTAWSKQDSEATDAIVREVIDRFSGKHVRQDILSVVKEEHDAWKREKRPTQRNTVPKTTSRRGATSKAAAQASFRTSPSDESKSSSSSASGD
ncbi:hypothetical protein NMY22_g10745 [Coprinellus aureogranulatus]|nr:hypothetical protein NMY22_g10745 [Coprinellus aureogranulatus]